MAKRITFLFLVFLGGAFPVLAADAQGAVDQAPPVVSLDFANGLYARKMYEPAVSEFQKFIETNPKSPDVASAKYRLSDSYYFMKKYKEAADSFAEFVKDFPADKRVFVARFRIGTSKYNSADYAAAEGALFSLSADAQDTDIKSGALFYLAKVYEATGKVPRMVTILKRLILNYPQTDYAAYSAFTVGDLSAKGGNFAEALKFFEQAAARQTPKSLADEAKHCIADIYFEQKDFTRAREYYLKLHESLKLNTEINDSLKANAILGIFYSDRELKDYDDAMKIFKESEDFIQKSKSKNLLLFSMAELASDGGSFDFALAKLDAVIQDPAGESDLKDKSFFKKSQILSQTHKTNEALLELQKIIDSESKDAPRAYFEKANLLFQDGKFEEALPYYKMAAEESSLEYEKLGLYGLAMTQNAKGDKKGAHASFVRLIRKFPNAEEAQRAYLEAVQIDLDSENYREAAYHLSKLIREYPKCEFLDVAYYKLGMAFAGSGKYEEAAGLFRKITERYKESKLYAEAYYGICVSLDKLGQTEGALEYYEKFARDFPQHALYKEALPRLAFLNMQASHFDQAAQIYADIFFKRKEFEMDSKIALWLIRYHLDKSEYPEMQEVLNGLKERYPKENLNHETEFFLGESLLGNKDYAQAIEHYTKAISLKADGVYVPHSYLGIGIANAVLGKDAEADKNFNEAARFDSAVEVGARARFEIANLRLKTGNIDEAAKGFMLVAILYDDNKYVPLALYKAGECFTQLGQTDGAQKARAELQSRYPDSDWAKKASSL